MSGVDELFAFVRRCVDEDERAALAAYGRNWDVDHEWVVTEDMHLAEVETASAHHIARWDPARVQAEVEAKRRILDEHTPRAPGYACPVCWDGAEAGEPIEAPCPTVRHLAEPYAGQDGWREEWRA